MIDNNWKERLHQYITGIIQNKGHTLIAINSMPDHLHVFMGTLPDQSLSDLIRIVKSESSAWININHLTPTLFRWQEGFGAFSYARSQLKTVASYVENQEKHHKRIAFLEEYKTLLDRFNVNYNDKYIFDLPG